MQVTGSLMVAMMVALCAVLAFAPAPAHAATKSDWKVYSAHRAINLVQAHVVTHSTLMEVNKRETDIFSIALQPEGLVLVTADLVAAESVTDEGIDESKTTSLSVGPAVLKEKRGREFATFDVDCSETKKRFFIRVVAHYVDAQELVPAEVDQTSPQYAVIHNSHYIPSAYPIADQSTAIYVSHASDYTELEPMSVNQAHKGAQEILFGPYPDVRSWMWSDLRMRFGNAAGFLVVKEQTREIEVSHWGNVAVEEWVHVENQGAKLKGQFSRLNFMHGAFGNGIRMVTQFLPEGATECYYRDQIGNISSSNVNTQRDGSVKLQLRPRFVLFGGWKVDWLTGYNLPSDKYLALDASGKYHLSIPFVSTFEDTRIRELEVRVILPEGATDIELHSPYEVEEQERGSRVTYLDTSGRPVVTFTAKDIVTSHGERDLVVTYNLAAGSLFYEPLLLISGYFCVFLAAIVFFRIDFSLPKTA